MSRPILITTPMLTLDEVVKDLGISKARRDSIIRIMEAGMASRRRGAEPTPVAAGRRKKKSRAVAGRNGARTKTK